MVNLKTDKEIEIMKEGGKKLQSVFDEIRLRMKVGMTTREVDKIAEDTIIKLGAEPSFKRVQGYYDTICISINDQVVHTPPSDRVINDNDVVTVDIGVFYKGFNTDKAITYHLSEKKDASIEKFLNAGREALKKGIKSARSGNFVGDISKSLQDVIEGNGYKIIKTLTGHGVGRDLHEDPAIPGFLKGDKTKTKKLVAGMTLAIEVIYAQTTGEIMEEDNNNWSLITVDGSLAACFEHTVAVLPQSTFILA